MARSGTAAVSAPPTDGDKKKIVTEARREAKRAYMAARYADPAFREAKKRDVLQRYHDLNPEARWGVRGRRPKKSPDLGIPAAVVILAGAALGAAVAAAF